MSDDWSLEKVKDDQEAFLDGLCIHEQDGYYFHECLLETLRQKLIEDFSVSTHYGSGMSRDIINKRFGVKE